MEGVKKGTILSALICYSVFLLGSFGLPDNSVANTLEPGFIKELAEGEEETEFRVGKIDFLSEKGVVIDDQAFSITPQTKYRTDAGVITNESHFSPGDPVKFVCDDQGGVLLELQMDLSGPVAQWLESREAVPGEQDSEVKRNSDVQLKDGVWTN